MKTPYCCDAIRDLYDEYYGQQQRGEGDFLVYAGAYRQRRHGLGDILRGLWRRFIPAVKTYAPRLIRAGGNIVEDVARGK